MLRSLGIDGFARTAARLLRVNLFHLASQLPAGEAARRAQERLYVTPYKWNFDVTYRCNSRCQTCLIWDHYDNSAEEAAREMPLQDYARLFDELGEDLLFASFEGGEPTMRDDFPEIVIEAIARCPQLRIVVIATNGAPPQRVARHIERIFEGRRRLGRERVQISVAVSLDGTEAVHNEVRGMRRGYAWAVDSAERIRAMGEAHSTVYFQTTISALNLDDMLRFHEAHRDWPIVYTCAHERDLFKNDGGGFALEDVGDAQRGDVQALVAELSRRQGFTRLDPAVLFDTLYLRLLRRYLDDGRVPVDCFAGFATVTLDAYGRLKACNFMEGALGNVREQSVREILASQPALRLKRDIKQQRCPRCWMNCDGVPSIAQSPARALLRAL